MNVDRLAAVSMELNNLSYRVLIRFWENKRKKRKEKKRKEKKRKEKKRKSHSLVVVHV